MANTVPAKFIATSKGGKPGKYMEGDYDEALAAAKAAAAGAGLHERNSKMRVHTVREKDGTLTRKFVFTKKTHAGHSKKYEK